MITVNVSSSQNRKCVVCNHKTGLSREYGYADGICITVPVCHKCEDKIGMFLGPAMEVHLKSIAQSVRMSRVITYDEKYVKKLKEDSHE